MVVSVNVMTDTDRKDAILKDLDIQWRDHFHMRDQTWKTVTNSALLFIGVVGLEIKEPSDLVLIPTYAVLIVMAIFGMTVAAHHRSRQQQKFIIISEYEKELGIAEFKKSILSRKDGLAGKIFTARFIAIMHLSICIVAIALLINRIIT